MNAIATELAPPPQAALKVRAVEPEFLTTEAPTKLLAKAGEKLRVAAMLEPLVGDGLMRSEDALLISSQASVIG